MVLYSATEAIAFALLISVQKILYNAILKMIVILKMNICAISEGSQVTNSWLSSHSIEDILEHLRLCLVDLCV